MTFITSTSSSYYASLLILLYANTALGSFGQIGLIEEPYPQDSQFANVIVGGSQATLGQFPWQVFISTYSTPTKAISGCGGIIKNESFIITAAHCVVLIMAKPALRLRITAGTIALPNQVYDKNAVQQVEADMVWVHPEAMNAILEAPADVGAIRASNKTKLFGRFMNNDVAMIRLSKPLVLNEFVKPIAMPLAYQAPSGRCAVSGWGKTSSSIYNDIANTLLFNKVNIVPYEECKQVFNTSLERSHVCVRGERNTGMCNGDSGGPLACDVAGTSVLFGIASFIRPPCGSGVPDVFVGVSHYLSFFDGHSPAKRLDYNDHENLVEGGRKLHSPRAAPWHVQITVEHRNWIFSTYTENCPGAIIAPNRVVTVASCVRAASDSTKITVHGGTLRMDLLENTRQISQVSRIWIHPVPQNNIALLELYEPFEFNEYVNQVDLPNSNHNFSGHNCTLVGYGTDEDFSEDLSDTPLVTTVQPFSLDVKSQCSDQMKKFEVPSTRPLICATLGKATKPHFFRRCLGTVGASMVCDVPENQVSCNSGSPSSFSSNTVLPQSQRTTRVLAGILSELVFCHPGSSVLFSDIAYFREFLSGKSNSTKVLSAQNVSKLIPATPRPPSNPIQLPTFGSGAYCKGNPFENLPNIMLPPRSFGRHLGVTILLKCATGYEVVMSKCGPPISNIKVRCEYNSSNEGKWVPNMLCKNKEEAITSTTATTISSTTTITTVAASTKTTTNRTPRRAIETTEKQENKWSLFRWLDLYQPRIAKTN